MSYYNLRNVFTQSPEKIKMTVLAVLGVLGAVVFKWDPSLLETVGVGIAVERLLDLFYVAPVKNADTEKRFLDAVALGQKQPSGAITYFSGPVGGGGSGGAPLQ